MLMPLTDTSEITNTIEKSCKELDSTSTVFHVKDCEVLLKNQDNKSDKLENCEALLVKIGSDPGKIQNPHGSAKSKGKQKGGKVASSGNVAKLKVCIDLLTSISFFFLLLQFCSNSVVLCQLHSFFHLTSTFQDLVTLLLKLYKLDGSKVLEKITGNKALSVIFSRTYKKIEHMQLNWSLHLSAFNISMSRVVW